MDFGYARVSKEEQNLHLQLDAFKEKGIDRRNIFIDKMSGTKWVRKGLDELLAKLQSGDRLFVWKLDRLGRSSVEIILTVMKIHEAGVQFISITEKEIDTTTPMGDFFFKLLALFAELERKIIVQRTNAGLAAARARGHKGGRRRTNLKVGKPATALKLYDDKTNTITSICSSLQISRPTLYRWVNQRKEQVEAQQKKES